MKRVLVVEDEKGAVKPAFDAANTFVLNNEYKIEWVEKSQDISKPVAQFTALFVDVSLAKTSVLDGIGIIDDIRKTEPDMLKKVAIITANTLIDKQKEEKGLADIKVFFKPLSYMAIASFIRESEKKSEEV